MLEKLKGMAKKFIGNRPSRSKGRARSGSHPTTTRPGSPSGNIDAPRSDSTFGIRNP